jgi:hypothetical protein
MALLKTKRAAVGVDGNYWRIIAVETHFGGPNQLWPSRHAKPVTYVHLAQYVDKAARNADAMSLETVRLVLDGESNGLPPDDPGYYKAPDYIPDPTRAAAYTAIKGMKDFLDAADD